MNWAYNALVYTPGAAPLIAAPLLVKNQFYDPRFAYLPSPWQWEHPANEWAFSTSQRLVARLTRAGYWQRAFDHLAGEPASLVHAHFASVGCTVMHLAKQHGLPLITSFYGADYEQLPFERPVYRKRYQRLFELSTLLLCEGAHGAATLANMGCPNAKIRIVPLGVEVEKIPYILREKRPKRLRLIQAASLVEKKGYLTTLEAVRLALPQCPGLTLTIVGEPVDSTLVTTMRQFIFQYQLEQQITWRKFVDTRQFHQVLGEYDAFIHPSCYAANRDCEGGAPIVLLDAQATGLPVLATEHCDIPGEVLHGQTGLLAPERDPEAQARHIERFYRMEDVEYQKFSLAARQHVEARFDVKHTAVALSELYRQVIGNADVAQ